ncbi:MAG: SDR family NAD(P)-dependent oxidoreductase, partial [Dietzia sp.]|nr:SDR family NAD(P)-dependent oxidoreductase [Dietzia sp.]
MRLEGKVAVITGAGSGMGRAMAELFASEGAKIVAADWNQESLDETVALVTGAGGTITGVQG